MKYFLCLFLISALLQSGCGPSPTQAAQKIAATTASSTRTTQLPSVTPPPTKNLPQGTQISPTFSLAEPGPYFAGNKEYTLIDNSRDGRKIELLIWYPAVKQTDADGREIIRDAVPDNRNAPYPLIITEDNSGRYIFLSHLATHGFIMVKVKSPPSDPAVEGNGFKLVQDFLFSLDHISTNPPDGLENMMDTNRVGVTGYSYGGDISLTISGARVDPEFYLSQCSQISSLVPKDFQWVYEEFYCQDARNWEAFTKFIGSKNTQSNDRLWQPFTDVRIKAVMPMAPTISWYFGPRGLAAVDRPTLLIWGTKDVVSPYPIEAQYTFDNLIIPDRYLISFVGRTHSMPFAEDAVLRIRHFATAFFGYYLMGREDFADYFSQDFVMQFDDLAWGVFKDK